MFLEGEGLIKLLGLEHLQQSQLETTYCHKI